MICKFKLLLLPLSSLSPPLGGWGVVGGKKWQATHIAPLQPLILAAFLPWGSSAGAGRARPAAAKLRIESYTFAKK